jgi:hypothetical protein
MSQITDGYFRKMFELVEASMHAGPQSIPRPAMLLSAGKRAGPGPAET